MSGSLSEDPAKTEKDCIRVLHIKKSMLNPPQISPCGRDDREDEHRTNQQPLPFRR